MPQKSSVDPRDPFSMTLLRSSRMLSKTYRKTDQGVVQVGFDGAKHFDVKNELARNIEEMLTLQQRIVSDPHTCIIRGALKAGVSGHYCQRKSKDNDDGPATMDEVDRRWFCVDLDKARTPWPVDPTDPISLTKAALWLRDSLASPFGCAACVVVFSSSAFLSITQDKQLELNAEGQPVFDPQKAKAHLWFLLDQPVGSDSLKVYCQHHGLDPATSVTVQPHYTAAPVFQGISDPLAERVFLLSGDPQVVTSEADPPLYDNAEATRRKAESQAIRDAVPRREVTRDADGKTPIEHFNETYGICEVLQWYGYTPSHDTDRWNRPGATTKGVSIKGGRSYHHSTEDPLWSQDEHARDPFDVFCMLDHNGDIKQAVKAAAEKLGLSRPAPTPTPRSTPSYPPDWDDAPPPDDQPLPPKTRHAETADQIRDRLMPAKDTALGNAERMRDLYGADLAHHPSLGWFAWNGQHWERDSLRPFAMYREMNRSLFVEASAEVDPKLRETRWKWAKRSEARAIRDETFALLESESGIRVAPEAWDANPFLLGVANGVLDLKSGTLREGRREDRISLVIPVAYDPDADCPTWIAFLHRIMGGEEEMVSYLQRACGYTLTGSIQEQVMWILHGNGKNGKSTFLGAMLSLMGNMGKTVQADLLTVRKHDSSSYWELAPLVSARMVMAAEAEQGKKLAESRVKDLTGGERINACFKYLNPFEFLPCFKLWYCTNHLPAIRGTDEGIWRRICKVPFLVQIPPDERDPDLPNKLKLELPGILAWMVEGCLCWQEVGLQPPKKVQDATAEYREEQDFLSAFLEDCCEIATGLEVSSRDLYKTYTRYCEEAGEYPLSQRRLAGRLQERGFTNPRKHGGVCWEGLSLQTERVNDLLSEAKRSNWHDDN